MINSLKNNNLEISELINVENEAQIDKEIVKTQDAEKFLIENTRNRSDAYYIQYFRPSLIS